jgi:hypothetical protein
MSQVERMANEAIYTLQLNSRDAVKYIQRNANCDKEAAESAFKTVVKFTGTKQ